MTDVFCYLQTIAKRLAMLLIGVVMLLGLTQTVVLAATDTAVKSNVTPNLSEPMSEENLAQLREQRREWQSKVSSTQNAPDDGVDSLNEALNEKLNLDEIVEDNEIIEETRKALNLDSANNRA